MAKTTKSRDRGARGAVAQPAKSTTRARTIRAGARKTEDRMPLPDPERIPLRVAGEETDAQRQYRERAQAARKQAAGRVVDAAPADIAAPGRVHQPVKESGLGTPSADARPGRSSISGPLLETPEATTDRLVRAQKDRIKVQATQTGYYDDIRRRAGEVFFIHGDGADGTAEDAFSARWMQRVADDTPMTGTKGPNQVIRERHDELLGISADTRPAAGARKGAARGRGRTASDDDVIGADD